MSSIETLRERLVERGCLSAESADQHLSRWREQAPERADSGEDFVDWLIEHGHLSPGQAEALLAGQVGEFELGPYRVQEPFAPGRLGTLYRAVHSEFDQPVTLKIFPEALQEDVESVARMGREIRVLAELDHPNIIRSFDVGRVGEVYYLALEQLHGESLATRLARLGRLPTEEACRIARDVASGLAHLHQNDVLHLDLRPANIWITEEGQPKVMEFGAARDAFAELDEVETGEYVTQTSTFVGQYDYMSPEQAEEEGEADSRSDIYALGCVLYHCLAGHPPFQEKNPVKLVLKHARRMPTLVSELVDDVPRPVDETLAGMLAKEPQERFSKAEDVRFALDQYVPAETSTVGVVNVSPQYLEWAQSRQPHESHRVAEDAEGITPELAKFLGWMGRRNARRARKR